ncbi:ankyrin [Schizopora paradoxa]|uniref:Ankyrin n=1 Tax=Schizopora paradoxa TaxID=27342 RepID=A0A0H2RYS6_9AGAM|nr:ankyrin [Schizopora paradoxa]
MPGLSIHKAAENKQLSLVIALVEENPDCVKATDDDGRTALHWAATVGAADIVAYLLEHGADKDVQDSMNWTPLHCA